MSGRPAGAVSLFRLRYDFHHIASRYVFDRREQVRGDIPALPVVGHHCHCLAVELHEGAGQTLIV